MKVFSIYLKTSQRMSTGCTCNAGKYFADSNQHVLRDLPPYGQICRVVDDAPKHLVNGTIGFDDLQALCLQNTWWGGPRKQGKEEQLTKGKAKKKDLKFITHTPITHAIFSMGNLKRLIYFGKDTLKFVTPTYSKKLPDLEFSTLNSPLRI